MKVIEALAAMDVVPIIYGEGPYDSRIEQMADVPAGKTIIHFEKADMKKAKQVLGGRACLSGFFPIYLLEWGTKQQVIDETKRTIDILAPGGTEAVVLTEDASKRVRQVARAGTFYMTQTVRKVAEVLDYCAENSAIGVITADFGVWKTEAVKAWRRKNAGKIDSAVFEFDEFSSTNKVDFVRVMARQFGITHEVGSQNGGLVFRKVCDYLCEHPCLLIFDQCETLRPRVCQVIRQIWDRTHEDGVGVVMLAAPILLSRLMAGKVADLGALTSRVGIWAPLGGLTRGEMAAIVKGEGFDEVDEGAFDLWFKATSGSMRRLARSLDLLKAKHSGKRVTEKTVQGVAAHLWGLSIS
jgi:DNA transposition AAA+ family ATPase